MRRKPLITLGFALLAFGAVSADEQWPQFRGTQAGAVADDPALPDTWSETENVAWKTDIPGAGWSSPVVWDDHVFVTATIAAARSVRPSRGSTIPATRTAR